MDARPSWIRRWSPRLVRVLGPALLVLAVVVPPPAGLSAAGWRTAAVGLWMALWWMTEVVPIPATSLLPLVLFPVTGVQGVREAAAPFAHPLIFLFLGGFMLALAMERWHLHRRLALAVLHRTGTRPAALVGGFMLASALLSMWISNTATALMMLPIGLSVVDLSGEGEERGPFAVALMLGIAYACSIGGMATLIGTPTNAVLAGFMSETYGVEIGFAGWMVFGVPVAAVGLGLAYLLLTRVVLPVRGHAIAGGAQFLAAERARLGPMTPPERRVAVVFGLTAVLWMGRPLLAAVVPGLSDTGIALFGALLLFLLPAGDDTAERVLNWTWARRLPWGVLLLFGGGLSLAGAISASGLAGWIGQALHGFRTWPPLLLVALVVLVIVLLTELTSNTATAAAFLPVLAPLAVAAGQNPLLLAVPATLAASCAFMLPVATPPNAIVYGSSFLTIPQMARAGLWLNLVFAALITAVAFTLLPAVLGLAPGVVPDWALTPSPLP